MTNLVDALNNATKKAAKSANIEIAILNELGETLKTQTLSAYDFDGGIKIFVRIVNNITAKYEGEKLSLSVKSNNTDVSINFEAGKFANKVSKLATLFIDEKFMFDTFDKDLRKEYRTAFYKFLDANVKNLVETVELIKLIDKTSKRDLSLALSNLSDKTLKIETNEIN